MNYELKNIPRHIAIIMDGNGRWAAERGKERSFGHQAGVDTVRRITSECTRLGVKYLTLYTFSTENWNRPADEIAALMGLVPFPGGGRNRPTSGACKNQIAGDDGPHGRQYHNDNDCGTELFITLGDYEGNP